MPLFQECYIHTHWSIAKNWDYSNIKRRCVGTLDINYDDGDEDGNNSDGDQGGMSPGAQPDSSMPHTENVLSKGIMHTTVCAQIVKSTHRYNHAKKLFDEIAAHFSSNDLFQSFVDVMRTVIITCTTGDPEAGFVRIKKYITIDPRLQRPKTKEPSLLPPVNVKQGRPKKNNRGKMVRELHWTARQCSFCLSRNPVHRAGSKCKPLMAKGMNVELSPQTFPLIFTLPAAPATNLIHFDGTRKPGFVHVQNKPQCTSTDVSTTLNESEQDDEGYICTLYVHATDCIGTFLVPTATLSDWTAQTNCRVYISGSDQLVRSSSAIGKPAKRKQPSVVLPTL